MAVVLVAVVVVVDVFVSCLSCVFACWLLSGFNFLILAIANDMVADWLHRKMVHLPRAVYLICFVPRYRIHPRKEEDA